MLGMSESPDEGRNCFVVSAFGGDVDSQRRHKQVLRHLVRKVLGDRFRVVRADEIDDEGLITNQIIEHLLEDDLVVADMTGLNPNVFYEVAVRHAARKPIIHLITRGQEIPFDVANMRAIQYALDDPDLLEEAQKELDRKVRAIEDGDWVANPNPISAALDVWLLQKSEEPAEREAGELLAAISDLREEVGLLRRRGVSSEEDRVLEDLVLQAVSRNDPISENELMENIAAPSKMVVQAMGQLLADQRIFLINGKLSTIPF
jgi:hypothetical protein